MKSHVFPGHLSSKTLIIDVRIRVGIQEAAHEKKKNAFHDGEDSGGAGRINLTALMDILSNIIFFLMAIENTDPKFSNTFYIANPDRQYVLNPTPKLSQYFSSSCRRE